MRTTLLLLLASTLLAQAPATPAAAPGAPKERGRPIPVGTMSQLMVDVIYPTSNDLFYIYREEPKNDVEWGKVRTSALTLAEAANLLMAPQRAYDDEDWMDDAKLLLDVGRKAYNAAVAKDVKAIEALNDELNDACVSCHQDYRQRYGRRPLATKSKPDTKQ
jgi:cytochrome c556